MGRRSVFEGTTIRTRLIAALVALLLLWGAASAAMLRELARIHERSEQIALEHLPRLKRANELVDLANETARLMGEMQLTADDARARDRVGKILGIREKVAAHARWFDAHTRHADARALLARIAALRLRYWAAQDRLFALTGRDPGVARAYYLKDVIGLQRRYVGAIDRLIRMEDARTAATAAHTRAEYERALYVLLGFSGLALVLAGGVGVAVVRSIMLPLEQAAALAREVAQGNLDIEPAAAGGDEVGQLAAALAQMAESLRLDRARRQATEQALRESRAQLRELVAHAESLQEQERLAIARELHDELGQAMTAARMELGVLRMRFGHLDPALPLQVERIKAVVDAMLQTMRGVVAALRPGPLDEGLVPAAEWLLATLPTRAGLACTLDAGPGDLQVGEAVRTAAFRILQEALTNVVRHADARAVRVGIALGDDGMLRLEVADDGIGIAETGAVRSFGLQGMRERARAFGGGIEFRATASGGTTLVATLDTRADRGASQVPMPAAPPERCRTCACAGARAVCSAPAWHWRDRQDRVEP